jgi:hypothetical protein
VDRIIVEHVPVSLCTLINRRTGKGEIQGNVFEETSVSFEKLSLTISGR